MKRRELTRQQAIKLWTQSASGAGCLPTAVVPTTAAARMNEANASTAGP